MTDKYHDFHIDAEDDTPTLVCNLEPKGFGGVQNEVDRFDYCPACGRELHSESDR